MKVTARISAAIAAAALCAVAAPGFAQTLNEKIGRDAPEKMREITNVHAGAGRMRFAPLLGPDALSTNLIFVHRGVIAPKSGIGQHYHNQCEEMFVILDGEAEFTVNGRTSRIAGPAGVPDVTGHAHAIYNPTDHPIEWLNINVGHTKRYDNFDLGDAREGAALDPVPQFMSMRLDRALLRPMSGQAQVMYRRVLEPTVFNTPWSYVDHVLVAPGGTFDAAKHADMSEMLYVVNGEGEVTVAGEKARIGKGDAVPVDLGQARSLRATGSAPLELMVVGVARDLAAKAAFAAATGK
ncbi:cupin domain-containing protein [Sphingomonas sp.]|uniref:cupin domain-containing protein n=1 Tax=Sphingomonas sp. TaxID=28214 RepID=UPI002C9FAC85|nr:cupin domain-containing protein [Sphingomonas sp.]HTG38332.1 cupin domain-containing protein [Sphingomonas sp.]